MIKLENFSVSGWDAAIRGMRNPMNSWEKSDSGRCIYNDDDPDYYYVGKNDLQLMKQLVAAGSDHSKFMRMINVTVDITAPLYWWKEMDTYKVGTVRNSCSTMHKIHSKEFELHDFSCEHLIIDSMNPNAPLAALTHTINVLNEYREKYLETTNKLYWWQLIQLLPSSYNQRATVQLNYAVLRAMYHARKMHRLDEWRKFCEWCESLPYAELITEVAA